jgi:hypothetical protein
MFLMTAKKVQKIIRKRLLLYHVVNSTQDKFEANIKQRDLNALCKPVLPVSLQREYYILTSSDIPFRGAEIRKKWKRKNIHHPFAVTRRKGNKIILGPPHAPADC